MRYLDRERPMNAMKDKDEGRCSKFSKYADKKEKFCVVLRECQIIGEYLMDLERILCKRNLNEICTKTNVSL